MQVFYWCTDPADTIMLLMHWRWWCADTADVSILLMQWRCWCGDATDVLMLMMQVCCWCTDSADTLMLLVLMHQWCWSTDAAEALMLLVMMCWSSGVTKKHQKFIFEYWQKYYLIMGCCEKVRGDLKYIVIGESPYSNMKTLRYAFMRFQENWYSYIYRISGWNSPLGSVHVLQQGTNQTNEVNNNKWTLVLTTVVLSIDRGYM